MGRPTPGDVHVNTPLTNISIAFLQSADAFVAAKAFPNIPVTKQSDRYYTYERGEFNRDEMRLRAPGTESAGGSYDVDNTPNYFCDTYAFHKDIPDQMRANADAVINPDREATEYVTHKALIKRERLWATRYFSTGVWTNEVAGAGSVGAGTVIYWSSDNSVPIEDIRTGKRTVQESTGYRPNIVVFSRTTYDILLDHPDIIDRVKYGQTPGKPAMSNLQILAQLFELDRVLVMDAIVNTAQEGAAPVHTFIGGKHAMLAYAAPNPGLMTPSAGYTFSWTGLLGAGAEGNVISRFRRKAKKSDRVEIEMSFDQKVIAADLGYFFKDIVQ